MLAFILRRLVLMVPMLVVLSIISFTVIQLPPGDYVTDMVNRIRAQSPFSEVPLRLFLRPKGAPGLPQPGSGADGHYPRRSGR